MMKWNIRKGMAMVLAVLMLFVLVACSTGSEPSQGGSSVTKQTNPTEGPLGSDPGENETVSPPIGDPTEATNPGPTEDPTEATNPDPTEDPTQGTLPDPTDPTEGTDPDPTEDPTQGTTPVPNTYTVTFESDGFETSSCEVEYGAKIPFPSLSRGDEYTFLYWTDKETGEKVTEEDFIYDTDKTFVAQWQKNWSTGF